MATIITEGKKKYWIDADGNKNRPANIAKHVKKRDKLVEKIFLKVDKANEALAELKEMAVREVVKFLEETASEHHAKWQGNTKLYNFSSDLQVEVSIAKKIGFDERLQVAKSKVDEYVLSLVKTSAKDLVTLVTRAFNVDKKGNVSVADILKLRNYEIDNPVWQEAMNLIDQALRVDSTKTYFRFARKDENGEWQNIVLSFSSL